MMKTRYKKTVLTGAIAMTMCAGLLSPPAFAAEHTATHTFSLGDLTGDLVGSTYGTTGLGQNTSILCTSEPCGEADILDDGDVEMFPIDSQYGFYVEDFVGAATKHLDEDYLEGHIGEIYESGELVGVAVSNAATDKFKVKYPMGTWCAGLGANSVKCSTEHYSVLEHVMTCNETIPYLYVENPLIFPTVQADLIDPDPDADPQVVGTCANGALADDLMVLVNGVLDHALIPDPFNPAAPDMVANESTVLNDIATGPDYAMTKKDDGKPLYRFGNFIKRPNDIRLYAKMELPAAWKVPGADYEVTSAKLVVEHLITNNPNDQLRPEDMENEGATGRKPGYTVDGSGNWISDQLCYEGDGDEIIQGTIFMNAQAAIPVPADGALPIDGTPYPYSSDLVGGFTNGWYTTTDRDPFDNVEVAGVADIENGGPRWRLIANKFGQDIPGLEIPTIECSPVPYTSSNIRYPVGDMTTTTINLLDWAPSTEIPVSPLSRSTGWVDASANLQNYTLTDGVPGEDSAVYSNTGVNGPTINGAPLSDDFDLLVYIKGDRKPTALYNATLQITWDDGGVVPPPVEPDLVMVSLTASASVVSIGDPVTLTATVRNDHPVPVSSKIVLRANDYLGEIGARIKETVTINPGDTYEMTYDWIATTNAPVPAYVTWSTWVINLTTAEDTSNNRASTVVRVNP